MKLYFELKKKRKLSKSGVIRAILTSSGSKERISTTVAITVKNWGKSFPKTITANSGIIAELKKYEAAFDEYMRKTVTGFNEVPSLNDAKVFILSRVKGLNTERGKKDIRSLMDLFFEEKQNKMKEGTRKEYRTVVKHLYDFKSNVQFADFNFAWGEKWMRFMSEKGTKNIKDKKIKNVQSITINKHISSLKTFCRWAVENKHTGAMGFEKIEPIKIVEQTLITLTEDEFNLYANYNFSKNKSLEQQRDVFAFVGFQGLRFQDLSKVEDSIQKNGKDYRLRLYTGKKNKELNMPIVAPALAILKKYDFKLPLISGQKTNTNIKAGVKVCGIDRKEIIVQQYLNDVKYIRKYVHEVISIHDARKTFTSRLIDEGMPIAQVMTYTTHEDYRSMKPYINTEKKKSDETLKLIFKKVA